MYKRQLEDFTLTLTAVTPNTAPATSVNILTSADTATVEITDNDSPAEITISDVTVDEGAGTATVVATLDTAVQGGVTADVVLTGVTADGSDFTINTGSITFAGTAGEMQNIVVNITDDMVVENTESLTVSLVSVTGAGSITATDTGTVTITDNDSPAAITINDVTVDEGAGTATVVATLDTAVQGGVTADVVLTGVTADGSDFTINTGSITFTGTAGEMQNIVVNIIDDLVVENAESLTVSLVSVAGAGSITATDTGTVTITDNDSPAAITLQDVTVNEGDGTITVTATLDTAVQGGVTANVVLTPGSAGFMDFNAITAAISFNGTANESVSIQIGINDDSIVESLEDFTVSLGNIVGAGTITSNTATVEIVDNDDAIVTLTAIETEASEQPVGTGVTNASFTLNLSNPSSTATDVDFTATPDSNTLLGAVRDGFETSTLAHLQGDYRILADGVEVTGNTITIPADQTSVAITIEVIDDVVVEVTENFDFALTDISSADPDVTLAANQGDNITITDDDQAEIIIKATDPDAIEPGEDSDEIGTFTIFVVVPGSVDAANPFGIPAPVSYNLEVGFTVSGTANVDPTLGPVDYDSISPAQAFFTAGVTQQDINVTPEDDLLVEGDETVILTLDPTSVFSSALAANVSDIVMVTSGDCDEATVVIEDDDFAASIPTVAEVYVNSTFWSQGFRDVADGVENDGNARGYFIPRGTDQIQTLPWDNVNQISVVFSEDVGPGGVDLGDFSFVSDSSYVNISGGGVIGVLPDITAAGGATLSYDAATFTATITFAPGEFFQQSVFDLVVDSAGIANAAGNNLDGDWVDQTTVSNSGDGVAGGDFVYRLLTLPGDTVDANIGTGFEEVNGADATEVRVLQNEVAIDFMGSTIVTPNFDIRADIDGDGEVDGGDANTVRVEQNAVLVFVGASSIAPGVTSSYTATSDSGLTKSSGEGERNNVAVTPVDTLELKGVDRSEIEAKGLTDEISRDSRIETKQNSESVEGSKNSLLRELDSFFTNLK